jgi:regulatory protein
VKSIDDNYQKALQYAFLLLRYRDRSEREIIERLQRKGFTEETGRRVAGYLKENRFIDDARFAEALKKTAVEQKHLGRKGVVYYLLSRGIPPEIVDGISGDDDEYLEVARSFVVSKLKKMNGLDKFTIKRRLWAALARKGYSSEIIGRVLRSYFDEEEICQY